MRGVRSGGESPARAEGRALDSVAIAPLLRALATTKIPRTMNKQTVKRVALAYSGGLDTSIIIPWLKDNYGCEVVAVAVDVGQAEETKHLADKAYKTGACDFHLVDAKE